MEASPTSSFNGPDKTNIEVTGDKEDSRSLHITVHKPATSHHVRPLPLLAARFTFDDHIRCMAAKQRLTKGRIKARQQKIQMIERLLEIPAESASHGHFGRSGPIPGRSHPVRVSQSATERRTTGAVSHDQSLSQSSSSSSIPQSGESQTGSSRGQRRGTIYVEQGVESSSPMQQTGGDLEQSGEVEVAEEATSESAFQALHHSRGDTPSRHDSSSHEGSPAPQEIPLEDLSRKNKSKRKEQLTRARLTQSRLSAELRKAQNHTRSDSQSPKRKSSGDSKLKAPVRGRSTSLTEAISGRSRSGTPERRLHSDSNPLPSSSATKHKVKTHSREIQTQTMLTVNTKGATVSKSDTSVSTGPKTLQPAPSPSVSLVQETEKCVDAQLKDSPKLMPPVDSDRVRSLSEISQTSSEMSQTGIELSQTNSETSSQNSTRSSENLDQLNLGLAVPTGAGAELSQATVTVERLAPPTGNEKNQSASTKLTELAQMVQQYKFEGDSGEVNTNVDK